MGWFREGQAPGHEGFVVGLRPSTNPDDHGWRAMGSFDFARPAAIQVACDCGWRSPRIAVPERTGWLPSVIYCSPEADALARALWERHMQDHGHIELRGDVVVDLALLKGDSR